MLMLRKHGASGNGSHILTVWQRVLTEPQRIVQMGGQGAARASQPEQSHDTQGLEEMPSLHIAVHMHANHTDHEAEHMYHDMIKASLDVSAKLPA